MSVDEKTRTSGESPREPTSGPVLPTVNPEVEKAQPVKTGIPSFVYVMYVAMLPVYQPAVTDQPFTDCSKQSMDYTELVCHPV